MKPKLTVTGADQVFVALRNTADRVSATARKTMHRGADQIVREAKLNTPHDDGELEDSIKKEVAYGERGRLQIDVVCGGIVRGVNVDNYAMEVHENYEGMLRHGPGPNTLAKMNANPGRYIGSKFLERARAAVAPKLIRDMIQAVTREFKL